MPVAHLIERMFCHVFPHPAIPELSIREQFAFFFRIAQELQYGGFLLWKTQCSISAGGDCAKDSLFKKLQQAFVADQKATLDFSIC